MHRIAALSPVDSLLDEQPWIRVEAMVLGVLGLRVARVVRKGDGRLHKQILFDDLDADKRRCGRPLMTLPGR